ncbi:MAG: hypothetical protein ACI4SG_00650 [Oligosphaeraceae bacterium]
MDKERFYTLKDANIAMGEVLRRLGAAMLADGKLELEHTTALYRSLKKATETLRKVNECRKEEILAAKEAGEEEE